MTSCCWLHEGRQQYADSAHLHLTTPLEAPLHACWGWYDGAVVQVVLVNGGTASTSELLAGALRDAAGVPLVGEKTFGKGVTQRVVPLSDGSVLLVSTASYMTPKHQLVHKVGLHLHTLV